ncbi:TPA: hypothetical protein JWK52_002086 [Escherichia albertii]|uniref:hypothetical protein n=1 Tax=Escherichia albertii TaxID=208962 RepID=UPI0013158D8A|nr:hypothetical protein [Escherichia albertii]WDB40663.1 hypothetical protein PS052_09835 [Escherichia albertii]WKU82666.1 hypothetical protein MJ90_10595 [Escherichia albertii]HAX3197318.1 hypothetical protein [Escherichia albertii]HAX3202107.1 hypothetical protein [Escherichia albertii]
MGYTNQLLAKRYACFSATRYWECFDGLTCLEFYFYKNKAQIKQQTKRIIDKNGA